MTASLDNHTLRDALLSRGFQDITSENRTTKSWRLQHPQMKHWVSIKLSKDVSQRMATAPLVLHPHDAQLLLSAQGVRGIRVVGPFGGSSTKYAGVHGHAVAVEDLRSVDALVLILTGGATEQSSMELASGVHNDAADPFQQLAARSASDFVEALQASADRMTAQQRAMLLGHAQAPGQRLSMEAIALLGGYESYAAANSQYGRLGHALADHFGIDGLTNWTQALATGDGEADARGHFLWTMRTNLVTALREMGWLTRDEDTITGTAQAAADLDAEGVNRLPTTRQALIEARVGQGLFRERVLGLWQSRCAVTGCAIQATLIASHAQAWSESSDEARLDPYNGLPLTASIDKLFDRGLISFDDKGRLLCKPGLTDADLSHLGLRPDARLRAEGLKARHLPYLAAHRARHGFE